MSAALRRPTVLGLFASGAFLLGLLMVAGGLGHTTVVLSLALGQQRPYDFRLAALLANGGILLYAGIVNLFLCRWIARGAAWALAWSGSASAALVVYCLLLLPLPAARDAAGPVLGLNGAYLLWLAGVWRWEMNTGAPGR